MSLWVCAIGLLSAVHAAPADPVYAPLTLAIATFATDGVEASLGADAGKLLRQGLAGSPLLDLRDSPRVQELLGGNSGRILANRPGVAQSVADQL